MYTCNHLKLNTYNTALVCQFPIIPLIIFGVLKFEWFKFNIHIVYIDYIPDSDTQTMTYGGSSKVKQ